MNEADDIPAVSREEAENADLIVCGLLSEIGPDQVVYRIGRCSQCGRRIFWSQEMPERPAKWCIDCLEARFGMDGR